MLEFTVVIPARHASTRLPGKMLADIGGKPMVVHVAERARASGAAEVLVATDHHEIARAVERYGYEACLTRADHPSGTDRIAEVVSQRGYPSTRIVVNVQGDEPLVEPTLIRQVAQRLSARPEVAIATACCPLSAAADLAEPNIVKVVLDSTENALYFSRAPIPYARDAFANGITQLPPALPAYRHIGLYAYRAAFLSIYAPLAPAPLEQFEALEQLRALWHGYRISVVISASSVHAGVDTASDLARVRAFIAARKPQ